MGNEKIAIGCDHAGFDLKNAVIEYLETNNIEYKDFGTYSKESCNYPEIAKIVASQIVEKKFTKGILLCGTGQGMAITANRLKGIRAVVINDIFSAKASRTHNDANILCLGERVLGKGLALELVDSWLNTKFEGGRHQVRVDMMDKI